MNGLTIAYELVMKQIEETNTWEMEKVTEKEVPEKIKVESLHRLLLNLNLNLNAWNKIQSINTWAVSHLR